MASGVLAGLLLGVLAAFAGGPLGDGRLAAVGPSGWQVAAVGALELGIGAAVTAGVINFVLLRRTAAAASPGPDPAAQRARPPTAPLPGGHVIYVDPWAGDQAGGKPPAPAGPAALP
jgi:hypothetical protein